MGAGPSRNEKRKAGRNASILTTISVSIRQTAIQFAEMRKNIYPLNLYTQSIYSCSYALPPGA